MRCVDLHFVKFQRFFAFSENNPNLKLHKSIKRKINTNM